LIIAICAAGPPQANAPNFRKRRNIEAGASRDLSGAPAASAENIGGQSHRFEVIGAFGPHLPIALRVGASSQPS
jgi:hypothetical protein